ncbi:hydrocephalus-inducing protein homolog [Xylocopa sonorina]|uniref:hydrocephalus-inducing protein homolog n=1 Tax=Xylocopa sonorina TaxID=1818115 RepID=UPI00403AFCF1
MLIMGEPSPIMSCLTLACTGQGPVVSAVPNSLNFAELRVLEERTMEFQLISDSPIPTQFNATLGRRSSPWSVEPESGELEPNGSIKITVRLFLLDADKYKDRITLSIVNSRSIFVDVEATGHGCSVIFEPQIFPTFDWGVLFSRQEIRRSITLTNRGTRNYQIIWSTEPEVKFRRGEIAVSRTAKFHVEPQIVDIPPGEVARVDCRLFWQVNERVQQEWYVFGHATGIGKRELIGTSSFTVTLTEPQILFSRKQLTFRVDLGPDFDQLQQTDELLVTNQSNLDLNVELSTKSPFYLITATEEHVEDMKIVLIDGATTRIRVFFTFDENDDRYSRQYCGTLRLEYKEHPHQDTIKCKGYVNFPNFVIEPTDFVIDCVLGSSAEKILTMTNNGPVPVVYKFLWLADSIEIERDTDSDHLVSSEPIPLECGCCLSSEAKSQTSEAEIQEASASREADEDICVSDRQDGSGDGPFKGITTPVNSPVSEARQCKSETSIEEKNSATSDCLVSSKEIREFLLPIVIPYFKSDEDLIALEGMRTDPPKKSYINEVLEIVPKEGTVLPYSVQRLHVGFHGFERLRIKATAVCEIVRGPNERIRVLARADAVRYEIDTDVIDFGQQLFLERKRSAFVLRNTCAIAFEYKVEGAEAASNQPIGGFDTQSLRVWPNSGTVDAESFVEFHVDHLPTILGSIDHQFQLEIAHLMPIPIKVSARGTLPQVYPRIPRGKPPRYHSIELEYRAIQSLTDSRIFNVEDIAAEKKDDLLDVDAGILTAEEWCIIPREETFPRIMDIDMAVERHLARKFVDANSYILMQHATTTRKHEPIPQLFSFEHVIDMGYVIVERAAHYTASVINYGPWNVGMKMKAAGRKDPLERSGIVVNFRKQSQLPLGESAVLQVIWCPTRDKFLERSTEVKHTIYIQVTHGCTIPINIKGIVTYPYVSVNTKFLDFRDVVVGECLVLCVLIRNE